VVADVLRRVEHAERQTVEEVARREQPGQVERIGVLSISHPTSHYNRLAQ
jgi:hypothetical protein